MNPNIKIINPHLWAVRFSWLQWIPDITIELNPAIPVEHEVYRILPNGVMLLNLDNSIYPLYEEQFPIFQKKKVKELRHRRDVLQKVETKNYGQELYLLICSAELKRRKFERKGGEI